MPAHEAPRQFSPRPFPLPASNLAAGVDPANLYRFTNGERSITLDTVDRLADALGLRLVETGRVRTPAKTPRRVRRKADTA